MEGKHGNLDGKGNEKCKKNQQLEAFGILLPHEGGNTERALVDIQGHNGNQQKYRTRKGIQKELDGGIALARPAPYGDEQIHGNEHCFPQHIKQHQIQRHEHAQHGCFHDQQADHEFLDAGLDILPRSQHAQRHDEGCHHHQQQRDAVHAQGVVDVQALDPGPVFRKLVQGIRWVKPRKQRQ